MTALLYVSCVLLIAHSALCVCISSHVRNHILSSPFISTRALKISTQINMTCESINFTLPEAWWRKISLSLRAWVAGQLSIDDQPTRNNMTIVVWCLRNWLCRGILCTLLTSHCRAHTAQHARVAGRHSAFNYRPLNGEKKRSPNGKTFIEGHTKLCLL